MTTAHTARLALADAVEARLRQLEGVTVYRGEVPDHPPVITTPEGPDPAGRIAPYTVLYPAPGRPDPNPSMAPVPADFLWSCQVTVVAGYTGDLDGTLDRLVPHLHLWTPTVAGLDCGHLRPPGGYDPGPVRRDRDVTPHRFFVPLLWQLHVVTAPPTETSTPPGGTP